jgi:hypothetical protein
MPSFWCPPDLRHDATNVGMRNPSTPRQFENAERSVPIGETGYTPAVQDKRIPKRLDLPAGARQTGASIGPEQTSMTKTDIDRVQAYLRRILGSERIQIVPPAKAGLSVEVAVNEEVIGTVHKDTDDGETSYSVMLTILEEDLPPPPKTAAPTRRAR